MSLPKEADPSRLTMSPIPPPPNSGSTGSSTYHALGVLLLRVAEGKEVYNKESVGRMTTQTEGAGQRGKEGQSW